MARARGAMDNASAYGAEDSRFDPWRARNCEFYKAQLESSEKVESGRFYSWQTRQLGFGGIRTLHQPQAWLKWSFVPAQFSCSRVAQWKRAARITQRSVDRNHALLTEILKMPQLCPEQGKLLRTWRKQKFSVSADDFDCNRREMVILL